MQNQPTDSCPAGDVSGDNHFVLACSESTYCCADQTTAMTTGNYSYCCDNSSAVFNLAPPTYLSGPKLPTPVFSKEQFSSTTSSSSKTQSTSASHTSTTGSGHSAAGQGTAALAGTDAQTGSSSLSTGAKAGIAIGVIIGVVLIAIGAFLVFRRRLSANKSSTPSKTSTTDNEKREVGSRDHPNEPKTGYFYGVGPSELSNSTAKHELHGVREPRELAATSLSSGLDGNQSRSEMGGVRLPMELEGNTA